MRRLLFCLLLAPSQEPARNGESEARRLARCIELYSTYTGRWPGTLEDLVRRPDGAAFWPDGGYWYGPLPKEAARKDGVVTIGLSSARVLPARRSAIVPPTDRLRKRFSARVRIQVLRAYVRAVLESTGKVPPDPREKDPWGDPYLYEVREDRVRIAVRDVERRRIVPTAEEIRALDEAGRLVLAEEERKRIAALLDVLAEDDLEPREMALEELRRYGPAVEGLLRERISGTNDAVARERLTRIAATFAPQVPIWRRELMPLAGFVLLPSKKQEEFSVACSNNLAQLWKMQGNYMIQFGGPKKYLPSETGADFWLKLSHIRPPLIDESLQDLYVCPASREEAGSDVCTYLGPSGDVNGAAYGDGDPVGLCEEDGHEDEVVVLRKSGDVQTCRRGDPLHRRAVEVLKR